MAWCETCKKEQPFIALEKFPQQKGRTPATEEHPEGVEYTWKGSAWGCEACSLSSPDSSPRSDDEISRNSIPRQY